MRWYLPFTSFIGYFRRNSPWPCSRRAAPLAQCEPRFSGESNTGSWRTHTPFSTTASTAHPTEQWPHTVRRTSTFVPPSAGCASAACARRMSVSWPAASPAPTPSPERRRKARRSIVGMVRATPRASPATRGDEDAATPASDDLRVSNMAPPEGSDLGGLVVPLHVRGEPVSAFGVRRLGLRGGFRLHGLRGDQLGGGHGGHAGHAGAKQKPAASDGGLGSLGRLHRSVLHDRLPLRCDLREPSRRTCPARERDASLCMILHINVSTASGSVNRC